MKYIYVVLSLAAMLVLSACSDTISGEAARFERVDEGQEEMGLPEPIKQPRPRNTPPVIEDLEFEFMGCTGSSGIVQIREENKLFRLGDRLNDFRAGQYGEEELPIVLKSGVFENSYSGDSHPYTQHITLGDAQLLYGQNSDYGEDPVYHIDLESASQRNIHYAIEFENPVDLTQIIESNWITMAGIKHVISPFDGDLTLFKGGLNVFSLQGDVVTVNVNGIEYQITLLGGNITSHAIIRVVSSQGSDTRSIPIGQSRTILGLHVYLEDIMQSEIGDPVFAAALLVGSEKVWIPSSAISPQEQYRYVELNGDDTEIFVWVEGSETNVSAIRFRFDPTDFENEETQRRWEWIIEGRTFQEPLYGIGILFDSHIITDGEEEFIVYLVTEDAVVVPNPSCTLRYSYSITDDIGITEYSVGSKNGNAHTTLSGDGNVRVQQNGRIHAPLEPAQHFLQIRARDTDGEETTAFAVVDVPAVN